MATRYVKDWFRRADDDLALIEILFKEGSFSPNPVCFHSQQAAEKYLKGFLAHHDLHVRKVHDLESLFKDCIKIDKSFENLKNSTSFLNQFYIETRYPGDYPEFSEKEAKEAFESAKNIKDFILSRII